MARLGWFRFNKVIHKKENVYFGSDVTCQILHYHGKPLKLKSYHIIVNSWHHITIYIHTAGKRSNINQKSLNVSREKIYSLNSFIIKYTVCITLPLNAHICNIHGGIWGEKRRRRRKKICVNVFLYPSVFRSNFPIQLCTVNL